MIQDVFTKLGFEKRSIVHFSLSIEDGESFMTDRFIDLDIPLIPEFIDISLTKVVYLSVKYSVMFSPHVVSIHPSGYC